MADVVRGQLLVTVYESSGKNKDDEDVWDPTFTEGFVKGMSLISLHRGSANRGSHLYLFVPMVCSFGAAALVGAS